MACESPAQGDALSPAAWDGSPPSTIVVSAPGGPLSAIPSTLVVVAWNTGIFSGLPLHDASAA
jgi:hypothetical protein